MPSGSRFESSATGSGRPDPALITVPFSHSGIPSTSRPGAEVKAVA